jgi:hypothetical protein
MTDITNALKPFHFRIQKIQVFVFSRGTDLGSL